MASNLKILDPVQGLIDYTNDIKPYHTKVIEALIEYVGVETIGVTIFEEFNFEIGLAYEFDGNYVCLLGGYGTPSFGDPADILILSPDVSKTVVDYPAIGSGFFITLGDKTTIFDPTVNISLSIESAIEDKIVDVTASAGSPPSGGSFTVLGDKQAEYAGSPTTFEVVGSAYNDGDYTIVSTTLLGSPVATQINVSEIVPTNNVEGFVSRISPENTGTFTVIDSEYTNNRLIPHTTVYITGIALNPPAPLSLDANQRFVSRINTQSLTCERILGYSRALRTYELSSPPIDYYTADEGLLTADIVNLNTSPASLSILGDFQSSNIFVGDEFTVANSSGNDGTYNITSISYEYAGSPVSNFVTTFGVAAIPDTNIDGHINLNVPSNVFIIDNGDYTRFFEQGSRVNITTGTHIGVYTTLNSKFVNGKTYIRVREPLIEEGTGRRILSTGANYISVDGDVTATYGGSPAQRFNIVTSLRNDGAYTSGGATYNALTNTTQIIILESFDITDASGEIHEFDAGDITHIPEGFGASIDFCEQVPEGLSSTTFTEEFDVLLGYKFVITGTDSTLNQIHFDDPAGYIADAFTSGLAGSPPITQVEILESGINNGTYDITALVVGSPPTGETILTVTGTLGDSGTFAGSPYINGGFLAYQPWWQYYVTNIAGSPPDTFVVAGDATDDITGSPATVRHIFTGIEYDVTSVNFDGINNGTYDITALVVGSPPTGETILTVTGSLDDSGTFAGSPYINGGFLAYQPWWQYYVTNIAGSPPDTFVVAGDATGDITGSPATVRHIFTGTDYTVASTNFDGINTAVTVVGPIQTTKSVGSPPTLVDVTAGSPPYDDWIISP
jgi:hypothetical protein